MAIDYKKILKGINYKKGLSAIKPKVKPDYKKLAKALSGRPTKVNVRPIKNIRRKSISQSKAKANLLMADDSFFKN